MKARIKVWGSVIGLGLLLIAAPHSMANLATTIVSSLTVFFTSLNLH